MRLPLLLAGIAPVALALTSCGGITGAKCPTGYVCVDNPNDNCDPKKGGADCPGICVKKPKKREAEDELESALEKRITSCGGFTGKPCPTGYVCVDDPRDSCNPKKGGADCPGICIKKPKKREAAEELELALEKRVTSCGGFTGKPCPTGYVCVDDPRDSCDPKKGGADCPGICVKKPKKREAEEELESALEKRVTSCGGITGAKCPAGYVCVDNPNDSCDPKKGGADCPGICVKKPKKREAEAELDALMKRATDCGGIRGTTCQAGYVCVDVPGDGCDPTNGGADCPGKCVKFVKCAGPNMIACPSGSHCVDDPRDSCNPKFARNCYGYCVPNNFPKRALLPASSLSPSPLEDRAAAKPCAGLTGIPCPAGYECKDNPTPDCPGGIAADCPGVCRKIEGSTCGGFANLQCPKGYDCVDNPNDGCDPSNGGADCSGICKASTQCGGFVGKPCADGYVCYQPNKQCADCFGRCVKTGGSCGGKSGKTCPKPLVCKDKPNDGCAPRSGGKDCPKVCLA